MFRFHLIGVGSVGLVGRLFGRRDIVVSGLGHLRWFWTVSSMSSRQLAEARVEGYSAEERTHWKVFSQGLSSENWGGDGAQQASRDRDNVVIRTEKLLMRRSSAIFAPATIVVGQRCRNDAWRRARKRMQGRRIHVSKKWFLHICIAFLTWVLPQLVPSKILDFHFGER